MAEFTEYVAKQDQRWDQIANEVYGSPYSYEPILMANPQYLGQATLPAGARLQIPVLTRIQTALTPDLLPPWKR